MQTGLHGGGDGRAGFGQGDFADDDDDEELEDELLEDDDDELLDEDDDDDEDSDRGGGGSQGGIDPGRGRLESQSERRSFRFRQGSFLTRL